MTERWMCLGCIQDSLLQHSIEEYKISDTDRESLKEDTGWSAVAEAVQLYYQRVHQRS